MLLLLVPLLVQVTAPTERQILEAEHARSLDASVLVAGTTSPSTRVQRLAVRAIGRFERPALRDAVVPLLRSPDADVRKEAINALGQMGVVYAYSSLIASEKDAAVRSVIYETIGRTTTATAQNADALMENEKVLSAALGDADIGARTGAARGLESLVRRNARATKPSAATVDALRKAIRDNPTEELRELAVLALTAAGDRDSTTLAIALHDASPQVRRLAVLAMRQWVDDASPLVRAEALRFATCGRTINFVDDPSEMAALAAVDALGNRKCDASIITSVIVRGKTWRLRAHALVSLAKVDVEAARKQLPPFVSSKNWHERVYAATAARILKDDATLAKLARDSDPNVVIEAMSTSDDAIRALSTGTHAGLLFTAANKLKGSPDLAKAQPVLFDALDRLTKTGRATVRDPRIAILERLGESVDSASATRLTKFVTPTPDIDPKVVALVAQILNRKNGTAVAASATAAQYKPAPLPTEPSMRSLDGATAIVTMKGLGTFTLQLLNDDAAVAVSTFAQLAESKKFNDLTLHRIVPNFVIQGGSPGADEYDGITSTFMRDEVGLARNARGSLGISTRGRDTGDGQIYVNMVDNFRLDHDYTVFARVTQGMDVVDRVQEGDMIESIQIIRSKASPNR